MTSAGATANYQDPALSRHASGAALSVLVRGLFWYKQKGLVIKGEPVMHPKVTSLDPADKPTRANILDCFDDSHWLIYKASGGLQDAQPGGHRRVTAVVQTITGAWRVTQLSTGPEGSC